MVRLVALTAALLLVALAAPAGAGGWAVTTLDAVPDRFEAGTAYDIGYTIRQHGVTPVSVDRTEIRATHSGSGKHLAFRGIPEGPVGHYVAKVTIPEAGTWSWDVTQGPFEAQPLGTLVVSMPGTAAVPVAPATTTAQPVPARPATPATAPDGLLLGGLLLALAGAAVLFGGRLATGITARSRAGVSAR